MNDRSAYVHTRHQVCRWSPMNPNENGAWETQCGEAFWFEVGTPTDNNMKFCPFCGGALIQVEEPTNEDH